MCAFDDPISAVDMTTLFELPTQRGARHDARGCATRLRRSRIGRRHANVGVPRHPTGVLRNGTCGPPRLRLSHCWTNDLQLCLSCVLTPRRRTCSTAGTPLWRLE